MSVPLSPLYPFKLKVENWSLTYHHQHTNCYQLSFGIRTVVFHNDEDKTGNPLKSKKTFMEKRVEEMIHDKGSALSVEHGDSGAIHLELS